ncbi:unnamed protein product (macronuclear) [Paramecium tetraurelia]|uniref:Transmembrane protein n=1 Tax=Paramecium tetraurelia TaxID=5888 RepID=A0DYT9_PARTE|nr:uncharacterized protein GSPATT00003174001 [Paramecium tetraurelia]CAK88206.1 unnamed protein product [Paramecium tetraurelia]|eukprot:XP_001455603.1 hypothetical protein (macronuclear) [Paramecium tetraurelia strain d4-2]
MGTNKNANTLNRKLLKRSWTIDIDPLQKPNKQRGLKSKVKLLLFCLCGYIQADCNRYQVHKKVIISYLFVKFFGNHKDSQDKHTRNCQRNNQKNMLAINQIKDKKVKAQKHNDYFYNAKVVKSVFAHLHFIQIFKFLVGESQGPSIKLQFIHKYIYFGKNLTLNAEAFLLIFVLLSEISSEFSYFQILFTLLFLQKRVNFKPIKLLNITEQVHQDNRPYCYYVTLNV